LIGFPKIFLGFLEIFDRCPGDIGSGPWRYLIGVLEIFERVPKNI